MSLRTSRPRLLLIGEGAAAEACARVLGLVGQERLANEALLRGESSLLRKADVLILAEEGDLRQALAGLLARSSEQTRRRPLRVLLVDEAISDGAAILAEAEAQRPAWVQLEYVSIPRRAARALLARWPLHWGADPRFGQRVHLLIVGECPFADALLLQALQLSGYGPGTTRVTLFSETSAAWRRRFEVAYPQAHQIADLRFESVVSPDWAVAPPVTMVVVCTEPATEALAQAQRLITELGHVQRCSPPVLMETGGLTAAGTIADWDGQLFPFDRRRLALERSALLEGQGDELAQVIHHHYRDTTEAQGRDPSKEPAGVAWPMLAESYRDANRHQADHLWAKLALTDCQAVSEEHVESFAFAPVEVEQLAIIEHGRWAADRWLDGWSYAPTRDNALKHHPQLIPYEQLSGPMKDLDRFAVRLVPTLLARSGLGVLRMLIVGLMSGDEGESMPARRLDRHIRQVLQRLVARYPDRALMIGASLEHPVVRRFAQIATDDYGAGLFLLLPQPLPALLASLDASAREQTLALMARAQRRIHLEAPSALARWLLERAEILVQLGATATWAQGAAKPIKQVRIRPSRATTWSFEY